MIKTLVVDDNKVIREYFEKMVDWPSMGFELVAVASNGIAGWRDYCNYRPTLIIADVHMPGMMGLELAKKIRETDPDAVIIFISSYEDFGYIKSAMDLGAYKYVLKHEARGMKLNEKLLEIKDEIENRLRRTKELYDSQLILALTSPDESEAENYFPDRYTMIMVDQTGVLPPFEEMTDRTIPRVPGEFYSDFYVRHRDALICGVKIEKSTRVALLRPDCDEGRFARELDREIYDKYHLHSYTLVLGENLPIKECLESFRSNRDQISARFFDKHRCVIRPRDLPKVRINLDDDVALLRQALRQGELETVCRAIDRFTELGTKDRDYRQLYAAVKALLDILSEYSGGIPEQDFGLYTYGDEKFWTNADEVFYWLKNKFILLLGYLRQYPAATFSVPVKKAIDYMRENFSRNDLTIVEVSNYVGLTANQLSVLMKSETGMTAIKWLTNTRMEAAKRLLERNGKVSDIYTRVGYTNLSYFTNAFKKACGETPLEYRRRAIEKNNKA